MVKTHNLGFPRIGAKRELKFALEALWKGQSSPEALQDVAAGLRKTHWLEQSQLDLVPVGDFALYDQVLDTSFLLGVVPKRVQDLGGNALDSYFRVARGRTAGDTQGVRASDMKKWFDTNYHYIVPELYAETQFSLNAEPLLTQLEEAKACGVTPKPVLLGPVTYLWLSKAWPGVDRLAMLEALVSVYAQLFEALAEHGVDWVQIDEPVLVTDLDADWKAALETTYKTLSKAPVRLLLASYFGALRDNLDLACQLPVAGLHIDAINAGDEIAALADKLPAQSVLSVGIVNGRNIWKSDLNTLLDTLEPIAQTLKDRLWLAPSCSLLHVPVTLENETKLDQEIRNWMSFAVQKLQEISILATALNTGREAVKAELADNAKAIQSRRQSPRVHNKAVQAAIAAITPDMEARNNAYQTRADLQRKRLDLPLYPTTTIGSFPQTSAIRATRKQFKKNAIDQNTYTERMRQEIEYSVREQEKLGLDVLVHGEPERNDMVEYFGEQLEGYVFSQSGWVQSYGSRCVKPPILYGDISRPNPMTLDWTLYAQSLTDKPVKGMLTGPVTMLNWSFVRDDQPRRDTCRQLALAIRHEVLDLEKAGVSIIQIDEAALREGLPLRQSEWKTYLDWAIESFRITANGVADETQIHTHMCYSRFNDIIEAIARMDADVITIETSRSNMELLDAFDAFSYPNEIGPGVYDIHSPNIPEQAHMVSLMQKAVQRIPAERLWINPDCGLKTRSWDEVVPALSNMVEAARTLREA